MKLTRWIDHLPPWLSFGAIATTGVFSPGELSAMALPLAAATLVESRRWDLARHRRTLEITALLAVLLQVILRLGLVPLTVNTLFLLCGIRLALPRQAPQRRQLILMGFLLFLVTAVATFEITFLFWALAWTAGACLVLLQQSWEASAALHRGLAPPPPYAFVLSWTAAALLIAGACFVILPRQTLGLRFFPWGAGGLGGSAAGLSDKIELLDKGPIAGNREIVLRILPPPDLTPEERERYREALQLLRGITLEDLVGQRWEARHDTPAPGPFLALPFDWERRGDRSARLTIEFFVAPNPFGVIPMPLGQVALLQPPGMPLREGMGGSIRWLYPSRRWIPLRVMVNPGRKAPEPLPRGTRLAALLDGGEGNEAALSWSRRVAPADLPAPALAARLEADLQTYAYTTENPSGKAENPIRDFLERTRAGHCEYFASSLALALRHRGVPARIVNGYRLGPWIDEGGYWLVTQDQAHSWVEYLDLERKTWHVADPTPPAPAGGFGGSTIWATVQRWTDALQFRWDRNVVRFSDEDQVAALSWFQAKARELPSWRPGKSALLVAGSALILFFGFRLVRRWLPAQRFQRGPLGIQALKPLLRKTKKEFPPLRGETARTWLLRLAEARPTLRLRLSGLAEAVDAASYGGRDQQELRNLVRGITRDFDT